MGTDNVLKFAPAIAIVFGLGIYVLRLNKKSLEMAAKIRELLGQTESLSLPDLVTKLGLRDNFLSRGKVISTLNPMVASGEVLQDEPPETNLATRLDEMRFRLRRAE